MVRASRTNGRSLEREAQASQASRCASASAGSSTVAELAQLLLEQVGTEELVVGLLDLGERDALAVGEVLGRLAQREAHVLERRALGAARLALGVPLRA